MSKKIVCLSMLLLVFSSKIWSQKSIDSLLIGSWQLSYYDIKGKVSNEPLNKIINFYANHSYQIRMKVNGLDSSAKLVLNKINADAGQWELDNRVRFVKFKNVHTIPSLSDLTLIDEEYFIHSINDTNLVLVGFEGRQKINYHYKRITPITALNDNFNPKINHESFLVNTSDTTILIKLYNHKPSTLISYDFSNDSVSKKTEISGTIGCVNDSVLTYLVWSESIKILKKNGCKSSTVNEYWLAGNFDNIEPRKLKIKDFQLFEYISPERDVLHSFGNQIVGFSVISTFLIAPLSSINFKTGDFNAKQYYSWAKAGLISFSVGLPLSLLTKPRQYKLTLKNSIKNADYWYIERIPVK